MNIRTKLWSCLFLCSLAATALAQKVKTGYDKSVDFSRYKTYTWTEPPAAPARPMLYAMVVGAVEDELHSKGLQSADKNGDLILMAAGGIDFGIGSAAATPLLSTFSGMPVAIDATMWAGAGGSANLASSYVSEGTLRLQFVDRGTNKVIWSGTVSEKLDFDNKKKSLDRISKAIAKLMKEYPPKAASK